MSDLGTLSGWGSVSFGWGINEAGQVTGGTNSTKTNNWGSLAFLYSNGVMTDLGTLGGIVEGLTSEGYAINNVGQVTVIHSPATGLCTPFCIAAAA